MPGPERLDRLAPIWQAAPMVFRTYPLRCGDGSFHAGHTDDPETRFGQHATGRDCGYTARRRSVTLAWAQDFPRRIEALEAERQIKGWSRAKKEALIAGDRERVSRLARSRGTCPSTRSGRTEETGATTLDPVRPEPVEGPVTDARP